MILRAVSLLALVMSFYFWIRGIVRGNKGDLIAGVILLFVISFGAIVIDHFGVRSVVGALLFLFGVATLVSGSFAKPDCPIKRKDRIIMATMFIVVGIFASLII
jgi:hypothetical protein